jgi:hypothetical protein
VQGIAIMVVRKTVVMAVVTACVASILAAEETVDAVDVVKAGPVGGGGELLLVNIAADEVTIGPVAARLSVVGIAVMEAVSEELYPSTKLVLKTSETVVVVRVVEDPPVVMVRRAVTTVEVFSRQPTLPFRRVGIASGRFSPAVMFARLQDSFG